MKNKFANPFNSKVAEHIRKDIDSIKDFYVNKWNIRDKVFKNLAQVLEDLADLMDVYVSLWFYWMVNWPRDRILH